MPRRSERKEKLRNKKSTPQISKTTGSAKSSTQETEEISPCQFNYAQVKPQSVQNRWFSVECDKEKMLLKILEYEFNSSKITFTKTEEVVVNMEHAKNEQIIGTPTYIAAYMDWVVVQYITVACTHIRFMLINVKTSLVVPFEDGDKYFKKDFVCAGPLECHLNDRDILIRLPKPMVKKAKSWVLHGSIETISHSDTTVTPLSKHSLQTSDHQAFVLHPIEKQLVYLATISSYGTKCNLDKIQLLDHNTHKICCSESLVLLRGNSTEISQLDMVVSNAGDWLVLVVLTSAGEDMYSTTAKHVHVQVVDSVTTKTKSQMTFTVKKGINDGEIKAIVSVCDSKVNIVYFNVTGDCQILSQLQLPVMISLLKTCRSVIRRQCSVKHIASLPLPAKLQKYLKYQL